ncbi:MAG: DUF3567 domain-containing protein [Burkholderiaceae bacterium]
MQMLYNSENFAVVRFDVAPDDAVHDDARPRGRGGFEIVDKFARKEIFLEGALAESFKKGVDALIETEPTAEEIDAYLERFAALMQQPLSFH